MIPGVFLLSFGIAIITKAGLGTSPISSIPFTMSMVTISAVLCIVFLHNLAGVREGTVICALTTGNIIRLLRKYVIKG